MTHKFTLEEIRMLAEAERMMDAGEVPFVMWHGHRVPVQPNCIAELGLEPGQTIIDVIALAIAEWNIASLKAQIALAEITKSSSGDGK